MTEEVFTPGRRPSKVTLALSFVVPLLFIGPGVWLLAQTVVGTRVDAKVTHCAVQSSGRAYSEICTARWTVDGRSVEGDLEGSSSSEVGHTVTATVRGDTAYSTSLELPVLLILIGLPFLGLPYQWFKADRRARAAP